jgi:hypothetical protein
MLSPGAKAAVTAFSVACTRRPSGRVAGCLHLVDVPVRVIRSTLALRHRRVELATAQAGCEWVVVGWSVVICGDDGGDDDIEMVVVVVVVVELVVLVLTVATPQRVSARGLTRNLPLQSRYTRTSMQAHTHRFVDQVKREQNGIYYSPLEQRQKWVAGHGVAVHVLVEREHL